MASDEEKAGRNSGLQVNPEWEAQRISHRFVKGGLLDFGYLLWEDSADFEGLCRNEL